MNISEVTNEGDPTRIASTALQLFFNIASKWELTIEEEHILLGNPPAAAFTEWKTNKSADSLDKETLERISHILNIYHCLKSLLPRGTAADHWVKKQNKAPIFGGDTALNYMLNGDIDDLAKVHQYLDTQCN